MKLSETLSDRAPRGRSWPRPSYISSSVSGQFITAKGLCMRGPRICLTEIGSANAKPDPYIPPSGRYKIPWWDFFFFNRLIIYPQTLYSCCELQYHPCTHSSQKPRGHWGCLPLYYLLSMEWVLELLTCLCLCPESKCRCLSGPPWIGQIPQIGFPVSNLHVLKEHFHISLGEIFLKCVFSHATALYENLKCLLTDSSLKFELLCKLLH